MTTFVLTKDNIDLVFNAPLGTPFEVDNSELTWMAIADYCRTSNPALAQEFVRRVVETTTDASLQTVLTRLNETVSHEILFSAVVWVLRECPRKVSSKRPFALFLGSSAMTTVEQFIANQLLIEVLETPSFASAPSIEYIRMVELLANDDVQALVAGHEKTFVNVCGALVDFLYQRGAKQKQVPIDSFKLACGTYLTSLVEQAPASWLINLRVHPDKQERDLLRYASYCMIPGVIIKTMIRKLGGHANELTPSVMHHTQHQPVPGCIGLWTDIIDETVDFEWSQRPDNPKENLSWTLILCVMARVENLTRSMATGNSREGIDVELAYLFQKCTPKQLKQLRAFNANWQNGTPSTFESLLTVYQLFESLAILMQPERVGPVQQLHGWFSGLCQQLNRLFHHVAMTS